MTQPISKLISSPSGEITHLNVREKTNEIIDFTYLVNLDNRYEIKPAPTGLGSRPDALGLYETVASVESLVGGMGTTFTDQMVFTKAYGGVRFYNESDGFEYFGLRRNTSDDAKGVVVGSPDDENYVVTKQTGGLTVYHVTDTDITQQLGNPASTNYIEATTFSFQVTSDQAKPFGILALLFNAETDTPFSDVPFDTRILNAAGTEVYSDIQNSAVWDVDPQPSGNPRFKLSSIGNTVVLPMSQPFTMYSGTTYTIEYRFKTPIRLKGDGAQPALVMGGKQLEFYPINYTSTVGVENSDFTVISGGEYKVDTTGGAIVATVHPTVKSAWFGDYAGTWSNTNTLTVQTDTGNIVFGNANQGKRFQIVRDGATWRIYNADGSLDSVV